MENNNNELVQGQKAQQTENKRKVAISNFSKSMTDVIQSELIKRNEGIMLTMANAIIDAKLQERFKILEQAYNTSQNMEKDLNKLQPDIVEAFDANGVIVRPRSWSAEGLAKKNNAEKKYKELTDNIDAIYEFKSSDNVAADAKSLDKLYVDLANKLK